MGGGCSLGAARWQTGGAGSVSDFRRSSTIPTRTPQARAALLTAGQCATYDEVKLLFTRTLGWEDSVATHFAVSGVSGLVTTTLICPVDMIKTNTFVGHERKLPYQVARDILREHGPRGLFRGCARVCVAAS